MRKFLQKLWRKLDYWEYFDHSENTSDEHRAGIPGIVFFVLLGIIFIALLFAFN
ncbi:MAG: hypothetical protein E6767_02330 [Dysgonomonas sp.]|nr:hypothetical protein [Dysgonomonas sp.]